MSAAATVRARVLPWSLLALALGAGVASAVVWRHDAKPQQALELGARFAAVGRVHPDGSATLIAPRWALTAAHVAARAASGGEVEFAGRRYAVRRAVLHPLGHPDPRDPGRPPEVDLALLELAEPVVGVAPLALHRGDDELGKPHALVGFGDFGPSAATLRRGDGARRAVMNVVDDAGPRRLFFRFDAPPKGEPLEGMGAAGDSGGPALLEVDGAWVVSGVSSGADGKPGAYGSTDIYVRVSTHREWIEAKLAAAPVR